MKKLIALLMITTLIFGLAACSQEAEQQPVQQQTKLTIYASFYPMRFLASEIAGDKAQVISLVPAGIEPHDWEPKPKTMAELQEADMLIYNGAGMEAWLNSIVASIKDAGVKTVDTSEGLKLLAYDEENADVHEDEGEQDSHGHTELAFDPHIWVSPIKYKQQAQNVLKALIEIDPTNEAYYQANYDKLAAELDKLDKDYREAIASFDSKIFIVSHAAFTYLANDYGLTQLAIRGVTPQAEPSPAKLAELVRICKENNIKYIFFETLVSPKLSETLATEIGAETLVLDAGQGITEEQIKEGQDYISIMYDNLENLKKALKSNE